MKRLLRHASAENLISKFLEPNPSGIFMIYLNFHAPINPNTSQILMNVLAGQMRKAEKEIYVLFSSEGGRVNDGVTLYNYIKSLPTKVIMHNIGVVDSVANVIFLAGAERYAVPNSSFLFHGVGFDITQKTRFEEKQIKERLLSIQRDVGLMANIIVERTKLPLEDVKKLFLEAQTKNPEEAKSVGIISEIREVNIPQNATIISLVFE
jgi:ATP-dependent protease ClpP protease subunit